MWTPRLPRQLLVACLSIPLALTAQGPVHADHADPPGPVNAQSTFLWGRPLWQDDFESARMPDFYRVRGRGVVRNQFGMLTLNTTRRGSVSATRAQPGHRTGRWEIRLRSARFSTGSRNFAVTTELIPAGGAAQRCGARNIGLERLRTGGSRARFYTRSLPDHQLTARERLSLADNEWHTFAVEVRRKRIAWFVDAHSVVVERRPEALSGAKLTVRFTMKAAVDRRMNASRMQMDWLRYFTLDRPNAKRVTGRAAALRTYRKAC